MNKATTIILMILALSFYVHSILSPKNGKSRNEVGIYGSSAPTPSQKMDGPPIFPEKKSPGGKCWRDEEKFHRKRQKFYPRQESLSV